MKITKQLAVIMAILFATTGIFAQGTIQQVYKYQEPAPKKKAASTGPSIELTPIAGYALNGSVSLYRAKFKMENAAQYGGILSVEVAPGKFAEFTYSNSTTTARFDDYISGDRFDYDMAINYFQLGAIQEVKAGPVTPFGLLSLGATWFNMQNHGVSDHVSFSAALGGGLKLFFSDRIGIRLQGRLLLPMYFSGGGLFVGIGNGGASSGVSVSTGVLAVQGDFSGGLIFRF